MANFDYIAAQKTALRLIAKFGHATSLARVTGESYDPVTGAASGGSNTVTDATVVSLPASGETVQAFDNRFKEDLKRGKIRFFYIAAKDLGFEPQPGDVLLFEGSTWDLAGSTPLNPAGTPLYYTVGVRASGKPITVFD